MPAGVARIMEDARASAAQGQIAALWEDEMARRVLAPLDCPVVMIKGTAFAAAGLSAGVVRSIGDLDLLVPRGRSAAVDVAPLGPGWGLCKPEPKDEVAYLVMTHRPNPR